MRPNLMGPAPVAVLGVAVTKALGAVGGVVVARILGPEAKGQHALALLVAVLLATALTGGTEIWAQRQLASGEEANVRGVVSYQRRVATGVLGLATLLGLAVDSLFWGGHGTVILGGAALALVSSLAMPGLGVLLGTGRIARHAASTAAGAGLYLVLSAGLASLNVRSVALVLMCATVGGALSLVLSEGAVRQLPGAPRVDWRSALRFGSGSMLGELAGLLASRVDLFIVAAFAGLATVGVYSVALAVTEVLILVPNAAAMLLLSRTARSPDADTTRRVVKVSMAATAALAVVVAVAAPTAVPLVFGEPFEDAVGLIWVLSLGSIVAAGAKVLVADLLGSGVSVPRFTSAISGLLVMSVADVVLVPQYGAAGAAAGSVLGSVVAAAVVLRAWRGRQAKAVVVRPSPDDAPPSERMALLHTAPVP